MLCVLIVTSLLQSVSQAIATLCGCIEPMGPGTSSPLLENGAESNSSKSDERCSALLSNYIFRVLDYCRPGDMSSPYAGRVERRQWGISKRSQMIEKVSMARMQPLYSNDIAAWSLHIELIYHV